MSPRDPLQRIAEPGLRVPRALESPSTTIYDAPSLKKHIGHLEAQLDPEALDRLLAGDFVVLGGGSSFPFPGRH
jgi:hypothetical protein